MSEKQEGMSGEVRRSLAIVDVGSQTSQTFGKCFPDEQAAHIYCIF